VIYAVAHATLSCLHAIDTLDAVHAHCARVYGQAMDVPLPDGLNPRPALHTTASALHYAYTLRADGAAALLPDRWVWLPILDDTDNVALSPLVDPGLDALHATRYAHLRTCARRADARQTHRQPE
jgi:hypothetical protein